MGKIQLLRNALHTFWEGGGRQRVLRGCLMPLLFICAMVATRTVSAQTITVDGNPGDWPAVLSSPSINFKVHVFDPFNTTTNDDVYEGSSADNIDIIPGWEWHLQGANDKTDIENAGAALIGNKIYFFGDRYSNSGTCAMSFWLFKNSVHKLPNGKFSAAHANGDILVSCNFDGGGGTANRVVYVWQSGSLVAATGLGIGGANVVPNSASVASPWPFTPKSGAANNYPDPSFLEAFVDLDSLRALGFAVDSCFAEFFISTRTSHTVSATLEDLASGLFGSAPDVTVANDTVCAGQPAFFTAITLGGLRPIQWSWNDTSSYGADSTYTINPAVKDTFVTVIAKGANGCRSGIDTGFLKVNPSATVDTVPNFVYCHGATGSAITFTSTPGGATFQWTSSANVGFGTSGTGGIGSYTATNTGSAPVVATVSVTATRNNCPGPIRVFTVTVNPIPNVTQTGDSTYCNGASAPGFSFSGGVTGTTFTWTGNNNVGFGLSGTGNIGPFVATNGGGATALTTTVVVTTSASGCPGGRDTFRVTVNPTPNVVAHGDSTYCNGASAGGLTFTGATAGTTFTWTASAQVGFGVGGTGNIPGYTATNTTTATIVSTVIVTPSANGCTGTPDTFLITVNPTPNVAAHGDSTYCNGASAGGLNFTGGVAGTTFTWTASAEVGFGVGGTGNIPGYLATNTTTATIVSTVIVTPSANGCTGAKDTFLITVYPTPNVAAHGDSTYCNGASAGGLNFTGGVAGTTFTWTASAEVGFGVGGTGNIPGYTATNTTTATMVSTVIVTPSANGCTGTPDTFLITVHPTPHVVAHGDSTYCNGASAGGLTFTNGVAGATFTWTASAEVGFGVAGTGNIPGYTAINTTTATIVSTVIVTPSANGCTGAADTFMITVYPTPNVDAHGDSTYCAGVIAGGLNFSGNVGGTTFSWTSTTDVGFGTSGTGNIAAYVALNGGVVPVTTTVVVTPSANGCTGTPDVFLITVNPNGAVNPVGNRVHCEGDIAPAIIFTSSVPGTTFSWVSSTSVGFGTSGTGNIPIYVAINGGTTPVVATVTVTPSASGCGSGAINFMVTVNPTPTVAAHGDSTYCNGTSAGALNFSGAVGGTAFIWTSSAEVGFGTAGTGNIGAYIATNNGTTPIVATVIVIPLANNCPGVPDTFLITVNPTPHVVAHGDSTYCNGASAGGLTFTNGVAGTTFTWTASAEVGFGIAGTGNIPGYTATNTTTATMVSTVIVTPSANGCTGAADTFLITVNPTPNVDAHGDSTYCAGVQGGALNFTGSVPGTTFSWTASADAGFGTSGTGNIPSYTAMNAGLTPIVATVIVTPSANGCTGTPDTFVITVNPNPSINPVSNRVYCAGDLATAINFSGSIPGITFSWESTLNVGFGTSGTGNIGGFNALNGGVAPVIATVNVTPSVTGCGGGIISFLVTVNPTPNVDAHGDSTYCAGVTAPGLSFTGSVPGTTFTWTASTDAGFGTSGTGNIPSYTALNGGLTNVVATVIVTPSKAGCTGTPDTFLITVTPNPTIDPVPNRVHCNGDAAAAINFSGSLPGITFTWVSSLNVGFGTSGTGNIPPYNALNTGTTPVVATVTVTPSVTSCGGGSITFMVTVNPTPNVDAHGDSTYCKGVTAPGLNFTGAVAGTTFTWTASVNVGFGVSGVGNIPAYATLNPGTTNLVATVIVTPSRYGCTGAKDTFLITIRPRPTVPYINNVTVCSNGSGGPINITGGDVVNTFTWVGTTNVGFGTSGVGNIGGFTAINNPGPGNIVDTVTVSVVTTTGCPGDSRTFKVTILPKPVVVARDTTVCAGTSLNLIPMGSPAGGTWSGPGVSGNTFNNGTPGTYKIYYTVNSGGCTGYDSAYICVTQCCVVYGAYTQGIWSSCNITLCDGKSNCGGRKTPVQLINYLLVSGGQITVGRPGRSVVIPTYAAATVNAVLPGSWGPNKLTYAGNVTISNVAGSLFAVNYLSGGKLNNSLLGEQIAMKLNIRMTPGLVNFPIEYTPAGDSYFQTFQANEVCCKFTCSDMCPICFKIKKSVAKYLTKGGTQAANLNSLVNLADDLLGGVVTPGQTIGGYIVPTYADVAAALGTVSSAFNYFRTFNGVYGCGAAKGAIASGTTPQEPLTIENQTRIYPNPTSGRFTIEVPMLEKDAHVTVMDMNGRSILSTTLSANPYEQKIQLEMPDVARGMYFIRIEADGKIFAKKLMLE